MKKTDRNVIKQFKNQLSLGVALYSDELARLKSLFKSPRSLGNGYVMSGHGRCLPPLFSCMCVFFLLLFSSFVSLGLAALFCYFLLFWALLAADDRLANYKELTNSDPFLHAATN